MRLNEIIDSKITNTKLDKRYKYKYKPEPEPTDGDRIGKGAFYTAFDIKDTPHEIRKKANLGLCTLDAQSTYYRYLIDNKITGNNINAPRIYSYDTQTDPSGEVRFKFETERLVDYTDISAEELLACLKLSFDSATIKRLRRDAVKLNDSNDGKGSKRIILRELSNLLRIQVKHKVGVDMSGDMEEMVLILREIISQCGAALDIHYENIMFRRTPVGIQLVLNDPLT